MTVIPDLACCDYFDRRLSPRTSARLRALGWLEPWAAFPEGPVPASGASSSEKVGTWQYWTSSGKPEGSKTF